MTLEEKIKDMVLVQCGEAPKAMTDTFDDLGFDSLDKIELVMDVEMAFELEVADDVAMGFKCPADVVAYLEKAGKVSA